MSFFETVKRSYVDVDTSKGIDTEQFLEATESLVTLFGELNSTAFSPVVKDMTGNITKIRARYLANPTANDTLENLTATEAPEKKRVATEGLLWLSRGLDFTEQALRFNLNNPSEELTVSFTTSYEETLSKHHNFVVRRIFSLAMKACPYRKDFYEKIGVLDDAALAVMEAWLNALKAIINTIQTIFTEHPEYIKGM
ncbi:hypothetical protein EC973_006913 [Apophysomyces ossiformis]|uniref:Glycolipid transfer protein domain-containing protein n=1 Tax=Apophysomyces ossiformis TaxID=679940 RepID=A0A8H7BQ00_9FUNG|nr:hypothetical protein EC973_006913 [Apophysomyces ossiformis]